MSMTGKAVMSKLEKNRASRGGQPAHVVGDHGSGHQHGRGDRRIRLFVFRLMGGLFLGRSSFFLPQKFHILSALPRIVVPEWESCHESDLSDL